MNGGAVEQPRGSEQFEALWRSPSGWISRLSAVNNQPIGKRFMVTSFVFFLLGGVMALLLRIQLARPQNTFLGPELYNQLFTMHGSTMMYLFVVPFLEGLALYLMPLMIGSRDVAYPRLSAFGYWMFLFGGGIFYLSFAFSAVPDAGWFAYTPLSGPRYRGLSMDFWLLGLSMVEVAGIVAGLEIAVTILKFRAPGMALHRLPVFAWAMLTTSIMIIFAFTTLLMATILLELDRAAGTRFFDAEHGGSSLLWQHLFWFFGHPEVYISFIPATGIVSMVVPVFARKKLAAYTLVVVAIIVTAFVSFGLWVHHMYTTGLPTLAMSFFAAASLMIAVASGTQIFAWIATLWRSRPLLKVPLLWVLGFVFVFVLGGMTGVMVAVVPFDWQVHDTFFIVAHFHYVLIGGVVFPIFGGIYYWYPKITGRMLGHRAGLWSFWLSFIGFNVTFFPMHIMGMLGMPRRTYTYLPELQVGGYNFVSTIGSFMLGAGVLVFLASAGMGLLRRPEHDPNPWNGDSLEWGVPSPPPNYGYLEPPRVRRLHALWDVGEQDDAESEESLRARRALRGYPERWRATLVTDAIDAEPQAIQALPGPTYIPLYTASAILLAAMGVLFDLYLVASFGAVCTAIAVIYWLKPDLEWLRLVRDDVVGADAGLPVFSTGARATGWWGWLSYAACAMTALGVLVYSYFYLRLFSTVWPQSGIARPEWLLPAIAYGIVAGAVLPAWLAQRLFGRRRRRWMTRLHIGLAAAGGAALVLILWHLLRQPFGPRVNAYASSFFVTQWFAMLQIAIAAAFSISVVARSHREGRDAHGPMALNVQLATHMWYLTAVFTVVVFAMLYVSPHVLPRIGE